MSPVSFEPGDISFPDQGLSLRLYRQNPQRRPITRRFGPAIAGGPSGREQDVPLAWGDWSGGGGATQPTDGVQNGYGYARNACTRFPHLVIPSGALTEVVLNLTGPNLIANPSFEVDVSGWTVFGAGTSALRNATDGSAGSACLELVFDGTSAFYGRSAMVSGLTPGARYTLAGAIKRTANVGAVQIDLTEAGIIDTTGIVLNSTAGSVGATWQQFSETFTYPLGGSGTVMVRLFADGTPAGSARFDDIRLTVQPPVDATSAPLGITSSAEQDGHLYLATGRYILRITNQTDPGPIIAADKDFGATVKADSLLEFDGSVWAGTFGAGATLWRLIAGGGGWTAVGTPPGVRKLAPVFWETVNASGVYGGRHEMIGTENATGQKTIKHIPAGSDPLVAANWSASIKIGPGACPINSLAGSPRHVFCCTSGGVADLDTLGNSPILNPDQALRRDDVINGAASIFRDGYIYYADTRGVSRINVSDAQGALHHEDTLCGPGASLSNETPIFGAAGRGVNPYAFAADSGWVILSIWNGLDSFVCYGRDEGRQNGAGRPIPTWHLGEYWLPGERITHMRITTPGGAAPRLWIGSVGSTGTVHLRWAALPGSASPLQELLNNLDTNGNYTGGMRWAAAWSIFMTRATWGDDNARKVLLRWDGRSERLTTATYLRVFAKDDATLSYTQQGSGADPKLDRSPRTELLPIAAGSDQITLGHALDVRVDGINPTTAPAVLRQLQARAEIVAEQRETITYLIDLSGPQSSRNGALSVEDPEDDWAALKRLQTNKPIRMVDDRGREVLVRVEPSLEKTEDLIRADSPNTYRSVDIAVLTVSVHITDPAELGLDLTEAVSPTTPGVTGVKWGSGRKYGDGTKWGATA